MFLTPRGGPLCPPVAFQVKIIAISGGGLAEPNVYLPVAKNLGAKRIFTKPFDRTKVLQAVQQFAGK